MNHKTLKSEAKTNLKALLKSKCLRKLRNKREELKNLKRHQQSISSIVQQMAYETALETSFNDKNTSRINFQPQPVGDLSANGVGFPVDGKRESYVHTFGGSTNFGINNVFGNHFQLQGQIQGQTPDQLGWNDKDFDPFGNQKDKDEENRLSDEEFIQLCIQIEEEIHKELEQEHINSYLEEEEEYFRYLIHQWESSQN